MKNPNFKTKIQYLQYCVEWKAKYTQVSQEIRNLKSEIRQSGHQITWTEAQQLREYKELATSMIVERKASKVEAQKQYLAAKQTLVAVEA